MKVARYPILKSSKSKHKDSDSLQEQKYVGSEYAITDGTINSYRQIVKRLWANSEDKKSQGGNLSDWVTASPMDVLNDLMARTDLNQNTMITYAYALCWDFSRKRDIPQFLEAEIKLLDYIATIKDNVPTIGKREGKRPSAGTSIPKGDFDMLVNELTKRAGSRSSIWARPALMWLQAGLATGIRPGEWTTAHWTDECHTAIRVTTSKVKAAPAGFMRQMVSGEEYQPDIRTRDIPVTSEADRLVIDMHMDTVGAYVLSGQMNFKQFNDNCGRQIALCCKKLWGNKKTYTLNSGRKQFSANMRAEVGAAKTAILMGHTRADTPSTRFYGKANQAFSRTGKNYRKNTQKDNQTEGTANTEIQSDADSTSYSPETDRDS